ncbi:MAG: hypothetical protein Ta2D_04890 [Rickettsiales bacterium]|nr:MAG: hypothetical protein Ta2D_04890 [Rickettsiales bacterium]
MKFINRLNKKVSIQEKLSVSDGSGGFNTEWNLLKLVWAEVKTIYLDENFMANQNQNLATHIITIRYMPNINVNNRIMYKENIFNIIGITNKENRILEIKARTTLLN